VLDKGIVEHRHLSCSTQLPCSQMPKLHEPFLVSCTSCFAFQPPPDMTCGCMSMLATHSSRIPNATTLCECSQPGKQNRRQRHQSMAFATRLADRVHSLRPRQRNVHVHVERSVPPVGNTLRFLTARTTGRTRQTRQQSFVIEA
jgi:hypothetical protein